MTFYRRHGWPQATHPSPEGKGIVVFLGPRHRARALAAMPLENFAPQNLGSVTAHIDSARPVATLIYVFTVSPDRQAELIELLARATEETMKHQPGFICANFHASQDGERVINYAQWESEDHYRAMLANREARIRMDETATIAMDVQPRLFRGESAHRH
ncbi:antibiotic biosynthesis monooxygenase family protein [Streptomyces lasalocidi]